MRGWSAARVAGAAGARLMAGSADAGSGPLRAGVDSRGLAPGELFVGLRGARADGGEHAIEALRAGAWGVLVTAQRASAVVESAGPELAAGAVVLEHPDPLRALQALALEWRRELGAGGTRVVAITGSTGKTSTKDILAAILSGGAIADANASGRHEAGRDGALRTVASPENFNTEIGLPLAVLGAPSDTEALVLELAMRGPGQIAELTAIAEPDVGVIVNVGPAHLEQLGTLESIASAKAELIAGLAAGSTAVLPAQEPLLAPHLRADLRTITFGAGGDVALEGNPAGEELIIRDGRRSPTQAAGGPAGVRMSLRPSFHQAHNLQNLLAAVAAARALGLTPDGALDVRFSALRGQRLTLPNGVVLIDDCYNANPMSMRAAIDDLAQSAPGRRVAVLGDMLELGPGAEGFHREIGEHAAARGIELLVTVGPLAAGMREGFAGEVHSLADAPAAAELLGALLREGDTLLVKGSRGMGLECVAEGLAGRAEPARGSVPDNAGAALGASYAGPGRR